MSVEPPPASLIHPEPAIQHDAAPQLAISYASDPTTDNFLISVVPPREPSLETDGKHKRAAVDICCVIDVSGSMNYELKTAIEAGMGRQSTGLTTLDIVKHAMKMIITSMENDDRIAIVSFSNTANIIAALTPMTDEGKIHVLQALKDLEAEGGTDLWAGLKMGMDILNGQVQTAASAPSRGSLQVSDTRLCSLFLLTDGMPNRNRPEIIPERFKTYFHPNSPRFSIHTFGLGCYLDSHLLLQIARFGHGVYSFIPDPSSLVTTFIHAVANLYNTVADQVELSINYLASEDANNSQGGPESMIVYNGEDATSSGSNIKIDVGTVQYGQTRDFVLSLKKISGLENSIGPILSVTARYRPWPHGSESLTCTLTLSHQDITRDEINEDLLRVQYHAHRLTFIRALNDHFDAAYRADLAPHPDPTAHLHADIIPRLKSLLSSLQASPLSSHPSALALGKDIEGEVLLALSSLNVYVRWGRDCLVSLARYHMLQQCGNYRTHGLQGYGADSPYFLSVRDGLAHEFGNLPQPEPTARPQPTSGVATISRRLGTTFVQRVAESITSAGRPNPCLDGACLITLENGEDIPIRTLKRGVRVRTPKGGREVIAVLESRMKGGNALLCELPGGLRVTPWHPIRTTGGWVFPISQVIPKVSPCESVYSLLLEPDKDPNAHGIYVQNVLCVTLGHGITESPLSVDGIIDDVRTHTFLGDYERVMDSLTTFPASDNGVFPISHVLRNDSGKICGFAP